MNVVHRHFAIGRVEREPGRVTRQWQPIPTDPVVKAARETRGHPQSPGALVHRPPRREILPAQTRGAFLQQNHFRADIVLKLAERGGGIRIARVPRNHAVARVRRRRVEQRRGRHPAAHQRPGDPERSHREHGEGPPRSRDQSERDQQQQWQRCDPTGTVEEERRDRAVVGVDPQHQGNRDDDGGVSQRESEAPAPQRGSSVQRAFPQGVRGPESDRIPYAFFIPHGGGPRGLDHRRRFGDADAPSYFQYR